MSAYLVEPNHIRFLVESALYVARRDFQPSVVRRFSWSGGLLSAATTTETGQMLWDENRRSLSYRYPDDEDDWKLDVYLHRPAGLFFKPSPAEILKSADCYAYQSCEHPDWAESNAHAFIAALCKRAYALTPGYEEAPWGAPDMG